MTTLIQATKIGDKFRDAMGGVSRIEYLDGLTVITRRKSSGRFPLYSVRTENGHHGSYSTLSEAIASL